MIVGLGFGVFAVLFIAYWGLLSRLVGAILDSPKLHKWHWLLIGAFNTVAVGATMVYTDNVFICCTVMMVLMLVDFLFGFRDTISGAMLCVLACFMHVVTVFMTVTSIVSISRGTLPVVTLADDATMLWVAILSFAMLDLAVMSVIKVVPLPMVRLINQHKEQQLFIITWMVVNLVFLLYISSAFYNSVYPISLLGNHIAASLSSMAGLYIVLFFSIKTSAILGYRDKNVALEHAIQQEQQYRNSMIRDALASYEVNVSRDMIIRGFEDMPEELRQANGSFTRMFGLVSRKTIYSKDAPEFLRVYSRANLITLFESGVSEAAVEYRRHHGEDSRYIWVRAMVNLVEDSETGDIKAFICVKNIDDEKIHQLELQRKAERDPLTGLYNKNMTGKLIDEHISFNKSLVHSALFMIDVDNFKEVNDHFGHVYGDAVLCELADKLVKIFRKNDVVGRVGGDEFIVFIKDGAVSNNVFGKAKEICKAFNTSYNGADGKHYSISSSVGISLFPHDGNNFMELYEHADVALYEAKSAGKNQYMFYDGNSFGGYTSQRTEIENTGSGAKKGFRENRIEYVFKMLYESESSVAAIHSVLELVARHFMFERGYIFETSKDGKTTSNTYEWCAEGVTPERHNLQELPLEAVATANANFQNNGTFVLKSLDDLRPIERAVLEPQGIKSMFQFGIFDKSRLLGFIGFDNCRSESVPDDADIDEIKTVCNILATFFVKQYIDDVAANDLSSRQEVMNQLNNYIYVINMDTFEVLFMNEKVQQLIPDSESGTPCYNFFRGNSEQCADCPIRTLSTSSVDRVVREVYNDKLGIWMESVASFLRWTDGSLACLMNCTDITSQKEARLSHIHQLETLAYVDTLTGGMSYHKFKEDAQAILDKQSDVQHLLVKTDIDNFRLINQLYGFDKGDSVLCSVAKALEATVRDANEIFARVASDEFIALFTIDDIAEADMLYEHFVKQFQRIVGNELAFRFNFPHGRYIISPSDAKLMDINDMFEKVNIAHKAAKADKAVTVAYYDERMTKEALRVKEVESKMVDALDNDEFIVYLQPKYYLHDETIGGSEALTRWGNDNGDLFYPGAFISVFERNGFITKLDLYIFRKVCNIIRGWLDNGIEPVVVSVNFSRLHLGNPSFISELCAIADNAGVDHHLLEIEITETVIYDHIETLEVLLDEIHQSGFSMSMDDFGSGYSSLGMLKSLPVDVIKMDRCFFTDQRDVERSKTVVGSIIQMADRLGIRIVAEGVEEQEQINFLRELRCDMVQGYYYAKPMPVDDFTKLLTAQNNAKCEA